MRTYRKNVSIRIVKNLYKETQNFFKFMHFM